MADNEEIAPGATCTRAEVMKVWGGSPQGGIAPSNESDSVLVYSDHTQGGRYGYRDGWLPDDGDGLVFEYTGHGPVGDQQMRMGNKAIRDHEARGRTLRVFVACGKPRQKPQAFRYLGEFGLDGAEPFFEREASDVNGEARNVIVFRMRPVGEPVVVDDDFLPPAPNTTITKWRPRAESQPAEATTSRRIPTERNDRTRSERKAVDPVSIKRREAELSARFERFLLSQGHEVSRYEIRVQGERAILRTDLCDDTDLVLYEAKGASGRDEIRNAIGQLHDYCRHVRPRPKKLAVLLPSGVTEDLRNLIESQGMALVYEDGGSFVGWPVTLS